MRLDKSGRFLAYGAGLALFAWFVFVTRAGLTCWFDGDDVMNLHYYWSRPWPALLKANLFFWSSYYRPAGGLFYRSIFAVWGFHPLPFRIAALALLYLNFALLAIVVRQLTESRWAALLALMVVGINPAFSAAYFDTGSIYDVLAYAFFWGAFAFYVHMRQAGRRPRAGHLALLLCLFAAALNSKEISISLPVAVMLYELVWHRPTNWTPAGLWHWTCHQGRFAAIGALFDIVYIAGKRYGPDSLWAVDAYRPHYSVAAYFQSLSHYLQELIVRPVTISSFEMAVLLAVMTLLAVVARRSYLIWGVGFILSGVLPLAFIPGRGGFAYLVPSVGWAVYFAGLLSWLLEALTGDRARVRWVAQSALLALLFIVLAPSQRRYIEMNAKAAQDLEGVLQNRFLLYQGQIHSLIPAPRKGARILLLSDADGRDDYGIYMLIRLLYLDPLLQPVRMSVWKEQHLQVDQSSFDYVLDWADGKFVLVGHK
jgi:hypothetical protein